MGIPLFYVTFLHVFFWMEFEVRFFGFAGFLRGVLKKGWFLVWCFGGEFVVDCMADVAVWQPLIRSRKMRQVLQLYFWLPALKAPCRLMFDRVVTL
jgi:hypothetical protein